MKELPPDPKPWTPPPERWYDRHEHTATTPASRTIMAMRMTVFDRLGFTTVAATYTISPAVVSLFEQCLLRHPDNLMETWRIMCAVLSPHHDANGEQLFLTALGRMAKGRGATE